VLRFRAGGRRRELTLGNYPDLSFVGARKLARTHRAAVDAGTDPAEENKTSKARSVAAWTVKELTKNFEEKVLQPPLADITIYYRTWDLENVVRPKLGSLTVRSVTAADVVHMLESTGRPWTVCKRILDNHMAAFRSRRRKADDRCEPMRGDQAKGDHGPRPPVRQRVMPSEEELRSLLADIDKTIGRENALALRILLATCVRGVELVKAKRKHVDLDRGAWWVSDGSVKTRAGFLVPLVPVVADPFRELLALAGDPAWVLPARTPVPTKKHGDTHVGRTTLWAAINHAFERADLDIRRFTPHDTRSTAKGHMRNMKIPNEITEIALNHQLKGMEAIYDVREEIPERREALQI
jgi:integrase